uniref:Uncharacterized protein n=1 Tax=Arundo donax TaxID=35708 RepID=A0A0A9HAT1_ARUDO
MIANSLHHVKQKCISGYGYIVKRHSHINSCVGGL